MPETNVPNDVTNNEQNNEQTPKLNPKDIKNSELFIKVSAQLAEKDKALKALEEQINQQKQEQELKQVEAQGTWKQLLEAKEKEIETLKTIQAKEKTDYEIRTEFLKQGCINETFIKGALLSYTEGDVNSFVESFANDESNSVFFKTGKVDETKQPKIDPPAHAPVTTDTKVSWEQVKKMTTSDKKEERAKAAQLIRDHMKAHNGEMPF